MCVSSLPEDAKVSHRIEKFRKDSSAHACAAAMGISERTSFKWAAADVKGSTQTRRPDAPIPRDGGGGSANVD